MILVSSFSCRCSCSWCIIRIRTVFRIFRGQTQFVVRCGTNRPTTDLKMAYQTVGHTHTNLLFLSFVLPFLLSIDTGGPLLVPGMVPEEDIQVGVSSWAADCSDGELPSLLCSHGAIVLSVHSNLTHTCIYILAYSSTLLSIHHCHLDHHRHPQTLSRPDSRVSATTITTLFVQTSAICRPPLLAVLGVPLEIRHPNQHPQRHRPFPPQQASRHL